jgi:hypothetical protein
MQMSRKLQWTVQIYQDGSLTAFLAAIRPKVMLADTIVFGKYVPA